MKSIRALNTTVKNLNTEFGHRREVILQVHACGRSEDQARSHRTTCPVIVSCLCPRKPVRICEVVTDNYIRRDTHA